MRRVIFGILILALLSVGACSLFGDDDSIARISEKGIDGIHFGDTEEEVWDTFGRPRATGWVNGRWPRSWKIIDYGTGGDEGDTLAVLVNMDSLFLVDAFGLKGTYSGTTAEGIGIGSTTDEVRRGFGQPLHRRESPNDNRQFIYHCMGEREVELLIDTDTVRSMLIGFNEPIEEYYIECD